jgi:hypothetical protein
MKISVQAKEAEGRAKPTVLVLPGTNKDGVGEDRSTIDGRKTQTLGGIVLMPARIRFLIQRQILTLTLVGRWLRLQVWNKFKGILLTRTRGLMMIHLPGLVSREKVTQLCCRKAVLQLTDNQRNISEGKILQLVDQVIPIALIVDLLGMWLGTVEGAMKDRRMWP